MKLDKIKFARLIAFCISNGMDVGEPEINFIDDIVDVEAEAAQVDNNQLESLMQEMANGARKIDAIRYHRALTGMSLKDSKDTVEKYWPVPKISATELQAKMLNVLNEDRCSIKGEGLKDTVRDFISSFSCYS